MPETIFNSYFLVSFRSDTIITWGKREDMYQHQKRLWLEEQFRKDQEAEQK